ncbi:transcriptional regulator [Parabacteroides sp. PF5-13]|uniref:transcriptional regulator n=1 Tax=Parabacteroides sp. PF5-13 TaxID=2940638 RepID=UPI002473196F|nr:transcriptional regulator [Parabacteroides sp. PF5-13]
MSYLMFLLLSTFAINASVCLPSITIRKYSLTEYNASGQNWNMEVSPDGILYVANSSGLLTFDGNTWNTYKLPDKSILRWVELAHDTVYTLSETSVGYWLPDSTGILKYQATKQVPAHIQFQKTSQDLQQLIHPLPSEIIKAKPSSYIFVNGLYFIGTLGQGIYITDSAGEILLHLTAAQGLQDNIVNDMLIENNRVIWIAFDNGLGKITLNSALSFLAYRNDVGKLKNAVLHNDTIYIKTNIGYYKRSIDLLEPFATIDEKKALSQLNNKTEIRKAQLDKFRQLAGQYSGLKEIENIYMASDSLAWLVNENEAEFFLAGRNHVQLKCRLIFDNYNANLVYREEQIFPLNDSLHLASTTQGVFLINTNRLIRNGGDRGLPLRLTGIAYKDDKEQYYLKASDNEKITLPYNFYEMMISVGASVFNSVNYISYKIDNISDEWSDWQRGGKIRFLKLPEGDYRLSVRKYVPYGDFPELHLLITVHPPWYKTDWFSFIFLGFLAFVLFAISRGYQRRLQKKEKNRLRAERQAEQQRLQQLQNEMLEAELQNERNELVKQSSTLMRNEEAISKLQKELEQQKKTLGSQYPTNLYLRMRKLIEETLNDSNEWQAFESYFDNAHQDFIKRFRQQYPDITNADLRLSCMLRMNLSTKEIASILNVSIRAVELRRYRLRKRLNLDSGINLTEFLMDF